MKIFELTKDQLLFLAANRPEWMAANRPEWMAGEVPEKILKLLEAMK